MLHEIENYLNQLKNEEYTHFCRQLKSLLQTETERRYTLAEHQIFLIRAAALAVDLLPNFPATDIQTGGNSASGASDSQSG